MKEKLLKRIEELLKKAEEVKRTGKLSRYGNYYIVNEDTFLEWSTNVENLIILIAGKDSIYYENFISNVKARHPYVIERYPSDVDNGIAILRALKEDLEKGFLVTIRDLVIAEVFSDFLDMAQHLLDNNYKDAAALLIGAVLEDGLRKIAEKNNIPVKISDDIGALNSKLADKRIYNRLIQRQIQAWKAIRDSAAHGRFNEYKLENVKLLLEGVRNFLAEYLIKSK